MMIHPFGNSENDGSAALTREFVYSSNFFEVGKVDVLNTAGDGLGAVACREHRVR
jgi:hypothetical protein